METVQMEEVSQSARCRGARGSRRAQRPSAPTGEPVLSLEIRAKLNEYFKEIGPVASAPEALNFIGRQDESVCPEVEEAIKQAFKARTKKLSLQANRGRELQKQVVVKNCSIDIEEEGARAMPASSSRSKSEPRKPSYVDGRIDFQMELVQWLMEERLPVDLTSITRFAPWLQKRYTVDKKGRRPQLFVFMAADVEAILKEHFPGNYRKGHLADPKKWEFVYEKSEFVRPSADEDEVLLGAIRELHGAGHKKESVLGTAELLRKESPHCRERTLGDLAQHMKELLSESQRRLQYDGAGKVECV